MGFAIDPTCINIGRLEARNQLDVNGAVGLIEG